MTPRRRTHARPSSAGRRAGAGRFSDPAPAGARPAARLSRQRRDDAETSGRHRRDLALLHRVQRERASRRARAERNCERGVRKRPRKVAAFFNAPHERQIIFTRGATEGINLVAHALWPDVSSAPATRSLISAMEHHSNIVPWQMLCEESGATPARDSDERRAASCCSTSSRRCSNERTKLVSVTHVSNALGTINPIKDMIAHRAQVWRAGAHRRMRRRRRTCRSTSRTSIATSMLLRSQDVRADRHRRRSTAKKRCSTQMPPFQGGGDMISTVTFEKTTWNALPHKFEAGTPDIAAQSGSARRSTTSQSIGLVSDCRARAGAPARTRPKRSPPSKACASSARHVERRASCRS